jgi:hypothetical protein
MLKGPKSFESDSFRDLQQYLKTFKTRLSAIDYSTFEQKFNIDSVFFSEEREDFSYYSSKVTTPQKLDKQQRG